VEVADVDLKLKVDKDGKDNFHFLKESSDTSSSKFEFALQEFGFSNVHLSYLDKATNSDVAFTVKNADLSGKFSSDNYSLSTEGRLFVDHYKKDSVDYLPQKNVSLDLVLDVDNNNSSYTFSKGGFKVEDMFLEMSGNIVRHEKGDQFNVQMKGKDMNIQSVLSLVPAKYKERISEYDSEGEFYFDAQVNGTLSEKSSPTVRAGFGTRNGEIGKGGSSVKMKNVQLTGKFFSGSDKEKKKSAITIDDFSCMLGGGSLKGSFRLDDLDYPLIAAKVVGNISLDDLHQFVRLDTFERVSGEMKINASFNGSWKNMKDYLSEGFDKVRSSGEMSLEHVNAKLKGNPNELQELNGSFIFENNDLQVNSFSGNVSGSDFDVKGVFKNVLSYFFAHDDMVVDANFHSKQLDLDALLEDKNATTKKDTSYHIVFPDHVDLNLETSIDKLKFRHFDAAGISGNVRIKDKRMVADPISLSSMDGQVSGSVMVDGTAESKLLITCDANLERLSINKLFYAFENFGQDYLVDKNLRGIVTSHVQFASVWSPDLRIDPDKVYALCDITVERGKLVGFEPIIGIAKDIRKDKIDNLVINSEEFEKRLKEISFTTMTNQVEIKQQRISFTPMTLKTSAMNIDFSGHHDFSNEIEYHFNFPFAELPLRSEDKRREANKEFGVEEKEKDGIWLYYTITGTVDKPVYSHNRKNNQTRKERMKEEREKEKQNLKDILRDEFGWFKKGDTLNTDKKDPDKKKDPKKDDGKFIIKWDDDKKKKEDEDLY
jgi:hypothetical protein